MLLNESVWRKDELGRVSPVRLDDIDEEWTGRCGSIWELLMSPSSFCASATAVSKPVPSDGGSLSGMSSRSLPSSTD